jgi:hypothetical protein
LPKWCGAAEEDDAYHQSAMAEVNTMYSHGGEAKEVDAAYQHGGTSNDDTARGGPANNDTT